MERSSQMVLVGILIGVLILSSFVGPAMAEDDSPGNDKTKPQWKFTSSQCSVAINAHGNVNLFQETLNPGNFLVWSNSFDDSSLTVATESDCYDGYTVSVYASNVQPNANVVNVLEHFQLKAEKGSSYADPDKVVLNLDDWSTLSATGSSHDIEVGNVNESDLHGNMNGNNVDGTEWIMDYRYEMDEEDVPNREYFVELTYTVSSP